jgi:hypothetical protein
MKIWVARAAQALIGPGCLLHITAPIFRVRWRCRARRIYTARASAATCGIAGLVTDIHRGGEYLYQAAAGSELTLECHASAEDRRKAKLAGCGG